MLVHISKGLEEMGEAYTFNAPPAPHNNFTSGVNKNPMSWYLIIIAKK
jgi:hypothetical protein